MRLHTNKYTYKTMYKGVDKEKKIIYKGFNILPIFNTIFFTF